jgi:hypothetical protein
MAIATGFKPLFDTVSQGAQAFARFVSTPGFQQFAQNVAGGLRQVGSVLHEVITAIGSVVSVIQDNAVPISAGLATTFVTVVIPALAGVAAGFTAWAAAAIPAAAATVVAFAPVLLPILAVTAAVAGLKVAYDTNFLGIRDAINGLKPVWDALMGAINKGIETLQNIGDMFGKIGAIVQVASNGIGVSLGLMTQAEADASNKAAIAGATHAATYETLKTDTVAAVHDMRDGIGADFETIRDQAAGRSQELRTAVVGQTTGMTTDMNTLLSAWGTDMGQQGDAGSNAFWHGILDQYDANDPVLKAQVDVLIARHDIRGALGMLGHEAGVAFANNLGKAIMAATDNLAKSLGSIPMIGGQIKGQLDALHAQVAQGLDAHAVEIAGVNAKMKLEGEKQIKAAQDSAAAAKKNADAQIQATGQAKDRVLSDLSAIGAGLSGKDGLAGHWQQMSDLANAAVDAGMPGLATKMQGYLKTMEAGGKVSTKALAADIDQALGDAQRSGNTHLAALAQDARDHMDAAATAADKAGEAGRRRRRRT